MPRTTTTRGTMAANAAHVDLSVASFGVVGIRVSGAFAATITFQGSIDGRQFNTMTVNTLTGISATTTTAAGQWTARCASFTVVRLLMSDYVSGTAVAFLMATPPLRRRAATVPAGGIATSAVGSAGIQYAPGDTGKIGTSTPPTGAAYVVDTVTQQHTIGITNLNSFVIVGANVTATYPAATPFRVYGSVGGYSPFDNNGCYTVVSAVFAAGNTTITVAASLVESADLSVDGFLTLGIVATYHIGSPGTAMHVGNGQVTTALLLTEAITAVNQGAKKFSMAGNFAATYAAPFTSLTVSGSTGNNATFTIVSAAFATGATAVTVSEAIPSSVADGTVRPGALADDEGCGHGLTVNVLTLT